MAVAATPIRMIDSSRPNTRMAGCSRAAPATANTLSSDIETSAISTCRKACLKLLAGLARGSVAGSSSRMARASSWSWVICSRSSRHIFQQTHSSSTPPASSRPITPSSQVVIRAKLMRSTTAAPRP